MGSLQNRPLPKLRWGIIGAGMISSWFVGDLIMPRKDARAQHIIQAIGTSSIAKGTAFAKQHIPNSNPTIHGSYAEVYADPNVDIVYIGTPHAFHKQICLDAIAAGKHVLCEKPFTITAKEAREVVDAAKDKGVFVMEAMWTRFMPLVLELRKNLFEDKIIGEVRRTFCDFAMDMGISALGPESRLQNPELGAGSLLDIGIYSLTWGLLTLDAKIGEQAEKPKVSALQSLVNQIDVATSVVLLYPSAGKHGVLTSSSEVKTERNFCRIEGTEGHVIVEGVAASAPHAFTVYPKLGISAQGVVEAVSDKPARETFTFEKEGRGFFYEADAVAVDIAEGRLESATMPHAETLRVMEMMDEIRRQGGARFPQDDQ